MGIVKLSSTTSTAPSFWSVTVSDARRKLSSGVIVRLTVSPIAAVSLSAATVPYFVSSTFTGYSIFSHTAETIISLSTVIGSPAPAKTVPPTVSILQPPKVLPAGEVKPQAGRAKLLPGMTVTLSISPLPPFASKDTV